MADHDSSARREKLSKTPSWIMLGFVIGLLFAFGVQRQFKKDEKASAAQPPAAAQPSAAPAQLPHSAASLKNRASLSAIENIFAQYESHAVWQHELTQIALWNNETNTFVECFEVLRNGETYFFRTIPQLTRPVIKPNPSPEAPLRFTEPEEVQLKRLKENSSIWLPPSTDPN